MPSRRSHSNSHHGCIQCKARRVKCDEQQPRCSRCRKKGQECTFKHLMSSYDPFSHKSRPSSTSSSFTASTTLRQTSLTSIPATHAHSSWPSPSITPLFEPASGSISIPPVPASLTISGFPLNRLQEPDRITQQLLYHYNTQISFIFISTNPQVEVLPDFHEAITRYSLAHAYVHHAVLTVSALHLASLMSVSNPTSRANSQHLVTALAHKASTIETLRPIIQSVTALTCEPALAASGLLTVCAFALPHAGATGDTIDLLAQIMSMYRGTVAIFRHGRESLNLLNNSTIPRLRQSVLAATAGEKPWPEAEAAVDRVLAKIFELDEESTTSRQEKRVLVDAGFKLKTAVRRVAGARGVHNVACMWLAMVQPAFTERVKTHCPLSLILVAHWVITLRDVKQIWWVQRWPEWTVQAVWREVRELYPDLMIWVLKEVGNEATSEAFHYPRG
ncbi:hypothetical protein F5B20DRAFT_256497 [Whalleya microplaca]|nr:hypothetical protein F5B20DRAFT_256497 [Whalleya microplaca]